MRREGWDHASPAEAAAEESGCSRVREPKEEKSRALEPKDKLSAPLSSAISTNSGREANNSDSLPNTRPNVRVEVLESTVWQYGAVHTFFSCHGKENSVTTGWFCQHA